MAIWTELSTNIKNTPLLTPSTWETDAARRDATRTTIFARFHPLISDKFVNSHNLAGGRLSQQRDKEHAVARPWKR